MASCRSQLKCSVSFEKAIAPNECPSLRPTHPTLGTSSVANQPPTTTSTPPPPPKLCSATPYSIQWMASVSLTLAVTPHLSLCSSPSLSLRRSPIKMNGSDDPGLLQHCVETQKVQRLELKKVNPREQRRRTAGWEVGLWCTWAGKRVPFGGW